MSGDASADHLGRSQGLPVTKRMYPVPPKYPILG
nr:MAG TPA: hypothetical protein [Caudoviricetes sp.]